jgi:hypothetical protein
VNDQRTAAAGWAELGLSNAANGESAKSPDTYITANRLRFRKFSEALKPLTSPPLPPMPSGRRGGFSTRVAVLAVSPTPFGGQPASPFVLPSPPPAAGLNPSDVPHAQRRGAEGLNRKDAKARRSRIGHA